MKKLFKKIILLSLTVYFIASTTMATTFSELALNLSNGLISTITKLAFGFAVVFFFWGVFIFVSNADDTSKREEGKQRIIWGLIAIFVMVTVWGILGAVEDTTNLDNSHLDINFL